MEITNIIGTPCLNTSHEALFALLRARTAELGVVTAVDFTNVHIVASRKLDSDFHSMTEQSDYFVPDSQILKWAVNLRGGSMRERVYGPDFLRYAITHSPASLKHYFLGGSQDCLDKLLGKISEKNTDFNICGARNGYFTDEDKILRNIDACRPDFIWVGLGTPKQQEWIARNRARFNNCTLLAVGFAFDVNAGTKKDAPKWMQASGLTWLYRLCAEPKRLWKRYLKYNSYFIVSFFREWISVSISKLYKK